MALEETAEAYEQRADDYSAMFESIADTHPEDRDVIRAWAVSQAGQILDVGCGPGHWTGWLHGQGVDIAGIDPVPTFIERARRNHPGVDFQVGRAEALEVKTSQLAGILAWYSLIHTAPELLGDTFIEFARALGPGGGLCVGFFAGPELVPFEHPIVAAYYWPWTDLAAVIRQAGFDGISVTLRPEQSGRTHAVITARRSP